MTRFTTQAEALAQSSAHVEQVNTGIQARLSTLAGAVDETSGFWRGDTQRTFTALMERWHGDADRLTDALTGIAHAMSQTGAAYAATEDRTTAAVRSARSGLNH